MKRKEKFRDRFAYHDKRVMEAYAKKEKNSLKKELLRLEDERSMMRDHLHRLEALIEKHNDPEAPLPKQPAQGSQKDGREIWPYLETKLKDWENRFGKIWAKKAEDHSDAEREYAEKELPLLRVEKRSLQMRLRSMEEIIAKTCILADDLNEDLCRNFSEGRTLADMGEIVLHKFGHKLKERHDKGRKTIRNFLEQRLKISKAVSRELFYLLEEAGTFRYRVDIPEDIKNVPLTYYPYEEELGAGAVLGMPYPLNGWWEIKA